MSMSERNARPGLQIALKNHGASLVGKFDDDVNGPRSVLGRVDTAAGIVLSTSCRNVGRETGVVPRWDSAVLEHVHEPLGHRPRRSKQAAMRNQDKISMINLFASQDRQRRTDTRMQELQGPPFALRATVDIRLRLA
jgi:hypothetical protein